LSDTATHKIAERKEMIKDNPEDRFKEQLK